MAEGGPDRGAASSEDLPFVERVRFMMYGDREKEAFLIEKKEKEEKKKGMRTRALSLHQQGWSWTKIATELGCHRTTVMRLVHKWQQTGCIADLPHRRKQPHPSRPAAHLPHHSDNRLVCQVPPLLKSAPRWLPQEGGENLNRAPRPHSSGRSTTITVRRRLKELRQQLGIQAPPSPPIPSPQKLQPKPQPECLKPPLSRRTLREVSGFSPEEWGRMVFSDMRVFLWDRAAGVRVWRGLGGLQDFFRGGGICATLWACVSGSGKKGHLLHVPDELTEERYVQVLHNGLLPSVAAIYGLDAHRFLFAQDRASIQASATVEAFLRQQRVACAEWPARSPDFNPCDMLWPEVEGRLPPRSATAPRSQAELVQTVRRAYESVDPEYIRWLVAPARLRSLCRRMLSVEESSSNLPTDDISSTPPHLSC